MEVLILHTIIEEQQQKAHRLHCSPEKNQIPKQYASLSQAVIIQAGRYHLPLKSCLVLHLKNP